MSPDSSFGKVRQRKSDKADTNHFDAEMPDAQAELARSMDLERLRKVLGHKVVRIRDTAGDSTLAPIGEDLGFSGQYSVRMASTEVRAAVVALNAAVVETERAAG